MPEQPNIEFFCQDNLGVARSAATAAVSGKTHPQRSIDTLAAQDFRLIDSRRAVHVEQRRSIFDPATSLRPHALISRRRRSLGRRQAQSESTPCQHALKGAPGNEQV